MVAHADNSVADTYKHAVVTHVQKVLAQTQADDDHAELLEELEGMEEKQLKKRLKKPDPGRRAERIDNHQGNGVVDGVDD